MNHDLPIPQRTMGRNGRYQDAARLYIHRRICAFPELAKECGLPSYKRLSAVAIMDKWDDFTAQLAAQSLPPSVWGGSMTSIQWAEKEKEQVLKERDAQLALVKQLRDQRDLCMSTLNQLLPGTKMYASAVSSLKLLNGELARLTGLDRFLEHLDFANRQRTLRTKDDSSAPQGSPDPKVTRGSIVEV